jgi:hypothetical protein
MSDPIILSHHKWTVHRFFSPDAAYRFTIGESTFGEYEIKVEKRYPTKDHVMYLTCGWIDRDPEEATTASDYDSCVQWLRHNGAVA